MGGMVNDPIEDPNFHPQRQRQPNPQRIARIQALAQERAQRQADTDKVRAQLRREIREAKQAGHSYPQLAQAAGVSVGVIQRMCKEDGE